MPTRNDRFRKQLAGTPVFTCRVCNKKTRDTGHNEQALEMCKRCILKATVENAQLDYGNGSPQYREAVAALARLGAEKK